LTEIQSQEKLSSTTTATCEIGAWQGLADDDPDVDAIFRMLFNKKIKFKPYQSVYINNNSYCPFNSQNTFWQKKVFPLLYLPATTSFRYTDILRSYVAQRIFRELNLHLGFTKATVFQERNFHDLLKDFNDEIECYLNTNTVIEKLDSLELNGNSCDMLKACYQCLIQNEMVKESEMELLDFWILDLKKIFSK